MLHNEARKLILEAYDKGVSVKELAKCFYVCAYEQRRAAASGAEGGRKIFSGTNSRSARADRGDAESSSSSCRKAGDGQAACRHVAAARVILLEDLLEASEKTILQKKEKILETIAVSRIFLELLGRFELPTSSLPMTRSTD
jgi:hypothetical protein